jgi:hypothetical protein
MSTAPMPPTNTGTPPPPPGGPDNPRELKLVSHSNLFYWWPVWLLGFSFATWTYFEDNRLAIVPADTAVTRDVRPDAKAEYTVKTQGDTRSLADAAVRSKDSTHPPAFRARVSQLTWMGPLFCCGLLLTMLITNVPLRGLWSFLVIILLVVVALLFSLFNVWEDLLQAVGNLHIYINMAGYLFIGTAVFILWAIATFIVDQRTFIVFTPGQIRVCEHIGASVRNFDTMGMTFEKQRDDLFRHYILGFGSGDLVVRTSGAHSEEIRLPNVLGLGWKLESIQDIVREKTMVSVDHHRK